MQIRVPVLTVVMLLLMALATGCNGSGATPDATPTLFSESDPTLPAQSLLPSAAVAGSPAAGTPQSSEESEMSEATALEPQGVEQRIEFEPGTTSTVIENSLVRGTQDRYILRAQEGQTMRVSIASLEANAVFSVEAIDGALHGGGPEQDPDVWEGVLPATNDYVITVGAIRGNATYRLEVSISPLSGNTPGPSDPQRISFDVGESHALLEGKLPADGKAAYVLRAMENQVMAVTLRASAPDTTLRVQEQDGTLLVERVGADSYWVDEFLPGTQDYTVTVEAGSESTYQLLVAVSALQATPQRIRFSPGTTSATLEGALGFGGDQREYVFGAAEGQSVVVEVTPADSSLFIYLRGTEDESRFYADESGRLVTTLPTTQDYVLSISSPQAAGSHLYTLTLTIP